MFISFKIILCLTTIKQFYFIVSNRELISIEICPHPKELFKYSLYNII